MFLYPLGLLALLAVPGVIALHLYRRRFEPKVISALFLWRSDDRTPLAGRVREPLRTSPSFWCEVLAALLLAIAFAGPRASCAGGAAEHLVVVLDSSASMAATSDGTSARDKAVQTVRGRIDGLRRGSRVTILASGARPKLIAGPAAFPAEARERLAEWQPRAARHDLLPALALGLELAGSGAVLVVTDHFEPDQWPASVELISIGSPEENFGLVHAARAREPSADGRVLDKVFLTVASFARTERTLAVRAKSGDRIVATKDVVVAPGARSHLAFEVPDGLGVLSIELPDDALATDNLVLLAPPPQRTLALFSTLADEEQRALGLSGPGERNIDRWLSVVPMSTDAGSLEDAHLVLARDAALGRSSWSFSLAPLGTARRDLIGPFLAERGSPLLAGTTLEGLVWSIDPDVVLPGAPLVSAGNQALLTEERSGERVLWHVNLDVARSSLQRSPDWPILLANMAELRRTALPGAADTNLRVGESLRYVPGSERTAEALERGDRYVLEGPLPAASANASGAQREIAALDQVIVDGLDEPGVYRLTFAGRVVAEFALSFVDAAESDLARALPGRREANAANARIEAELSWIEFALIALALGAIALDWWVLQRVGRRFIGVS